MLLHSQTGFAPANRSKDVLPDPQPPVELRVVVGPSLQRSAMHKVLYLSGQTRGGTMEAISRSFAPTLRSLGIEMVELSLLDPDFLTKLNALKYKELLFIFSWCGMGFGAQLQQEGKPIDLWQRVGIPFITLHGDSPAYFFDRHIPHNSNVTILYTFAEHTALRRRLPGLRGPVDTLPHILFDAVPREQIDFPQKRTGKLLFLKNGKDPEALRRKWTLCFAGRPLEALQEIASHLEANLDDPAANQIDDLVLRYFADRGWDTQSLLNLRLLLIAQLDDFLRGVKCTRLARALMDFPVLIVGQEWQHLDFTGKRATYIDACDYNESIGLIQTSLGTIDMSPNTASSPHDRVMRAYGAHTLCLTNEQAFLDPLPQRDRMSFRYTDDSLEDRVAELIADPARTVDTGIEVAAAFTRLHPLQNAFLQMLDYASLCRVDNLPHRPEPLQDYFGWPPTRL